MGVDVNEAGLNLGDAVGILRGFGFGEEGVALLVRLQHNLDQALRAVRRFLGERADTPARGNGDAAGFERQIAPDRGEQRRFADAVAADEADARTGHDMGGAVIDEQPAGDPDRDVGDGKHGGVSAHSALRRNSGSALVAILQPKLGQKVLQPVRHRAFGPEMIAEPFADHFAHESVRRGVDLGSR